MKVKAVHGGQLCDRRVSAGRPSGVPAGDMEVLGGIGIHPTGWRVSHIEHKLSISSGVGVTIGQGAD